MKRHELLHYVDTSMGSGSPVWALLGNGISSLTEEMNPEEETNQWINQENGDSEIKSYTPSIEVEKQDCVSDEAQAWIDEMIDTLPTGEAATSAYIRFRLKDKAGGGSIHGIQTKLCSHGQQYRRRCGRQRGELHQVKR